MQQLDLPEVEEARESVVRLVKFIKTAGVEMWSTDRMESKERQTCHHRHEELQIPRVLVCLILVRISTEEQGRTWLL